MAWAADERKEPLEPPCVDVRRRAELRAAVRVAVTATARGPTTAAPLCSDAALPGEREAMAARSPAPVPPAAAAAPVPVPVPVPVELLGLCVAPVLAATRTARVCVRAVAPSPRCAARPLPLRARPAAAVASGE